MGSGSVTRLVVAHPHGGVDDHVSRGRHQTPEGGQLGGSRRHAGVAQKPLGEAQVGVETVGEYCIHINQHPLHVGVQDVQVLDDVQGSVPGEGDWNEIE